MCLKGLTQGNSLLGSPLVSLSTYVGQCAGGLVTHTSPQKPLSSSVCHKNSSSIGTRNEIFLLWFCLFF